MKKLLYAVPLLIAIFIASCEQEDEMLNLASSSEADVQPLEMQANATGFIGRIAISADGNDHDRDDIGATPMGLAIIAHLGLQNKVVHYDYNSHIWGNESYAQKREMTESALGAASRFGFNNSVFVSAIDETNKAENKIANAINNSSSSNPLYLLVGGPMAVVSEGIKKSDQGKRKYVTVISHSTWNNEYQHNGADTAEDVKKTGVKFVQIKDQNAGLHKRYELWSWLKNHSNGKLRWVYQRMQASDKPRGDVSDAGMVWYLLKNDQDATPDKLKSFFASSAPTVDPKDNDGDSGSGSNDGNCQASGSTLDQAIKNFENACGIKYDKNKGHDCDPNGNGGWTCASGDVGSSGGSSGGETSSPSGGSGDCQASGSTLNQAISNLEKACGITYNKNKGHDCDTDGKGGWICSTGDVGSSSGSSGGGTSPGTSSPSGGSGDCQASGSTLDQAIKNFENACGIKYNKDKGHDCDPDGKGGWICSTGDL